MNNHKGMDPSSVAFSPNKRLSWLFVIGIVSAISVSACVNAPVIDGKTVRKKDVSTNEDGRSLPGNRKPGGGSSQDSPGPRKPGGGIKPAPSEWDTPSSQYRPSWSGLVGERQVTCGDGVVDAGEACDDGNVENGDGCSDHCTLTAASGARCEAKGETHYIPFVTKVRSTNTLPVPCLTAPGVKIADLLDNDGYPRLEVCSSDPIKDTRGKNNFKTWFRGKPVSSERAEHVEGSHIEDVSGQATEIYYIKEKKKGTVSQPASRREKDYPLPHWLLDAQAKGFNRGSVAPYFVRSARIPFKYKGAEKLNFGATGLVLVFINGIKAYEKATGTGKNAWQAFSISIDEEIDPATNKKVSKKYHLKEGGYYELSIFHFNFDDSTGINQLVLSLPDEVVGPTMCQACGDGRVFSFVEPAKGKEGFLSPMQGGYPYVAPGKRAAGVEQCDAVGGELGCSSDCFVEENYYCYTMYDGSSHCTDKQMH